jgi:DNA polymerase-3 subunit epsilon
MFDWFSPEAKKKRLLKKVTHPIAQRYLETPFPKLTDNVWDLDYLVLDFETTGLDPNKDAILSMGYTEIKQGRVHLSACKHRIIKLNMVLPPETVVVHKITDDRMQAGMHLHDALHELLEHMTGKVIVVHYEPIEHNFLKGAMTRVYGQALPMLFVDTLAMEKRFMDKSMQVVKPNQLRLGNLRKHYNLPRYPAHNALEDAIATAELFLAELCQMQESQPNVTLGNLLS